jgi:hypothetical protein
MSQAQRDRQYLQFTHPTSKFELMAKQSSEVFTLKSPLAMPDGYVSLVEAMRILGRSHQQIDRYVKTDQITSRMIHRPNRKPERVFLESSLIARRDQEHRRKAIRPPSQLAPKPQAAALALAAPVAAASQALEKVAAGIVGFTSAFDSYTQRKPAVPITEKLWLSLEEAADYSGLVRADLLRLIQAGTLKARKSGGWKLQRKSLEAFNG